MIQFNIYLSNLFHQFIYIEHSIEMIDFVLDDDGGKSGEFEDALFLCFIVVAKLDIFVSRDKTLFGFWEREASFFDITARFRRCFQYFWIEHHNSRKIFIFPVTKETHDNQTLCNTDLWCSKPHSCIIWIFDIVAHFLTEFYVLFPLSAFYRFTHSSQDGIFFSYFDMEHSFH